MDQIGHYALWSLPVHLGRFRVTFEHEAEDLDTLLRAVAESLRVDLYWAAPLADSLVLRARDVFLTAAGCERLSPIGAFGVAVSYLVHLRRKGHYEESTATKLGRYWLQFADYVERRYDLVDIRDVTRNHVEAWLAAPLLGAELKKASDTTWSQRRWALRTFFQILRQLDQFDGDPLVDLPPRPRPQFSQRPLSDAEHVRARRFAEKTTRDRRSPAGLALAETTASTYEIPRVLVADVDFTRMRVWLDGAPRRLRGRWGRLDEWCAEQIERRIRHLKNATADTPIIYEGDGDAESMVASAGSLFAQVFTRAGFYPDAQLKPNAVRAWAAAKIFEQSRDIRYVAHRCGYEDLDRAAELINLEPMAADEPPSHRAAR